MFRGLASVDVLNRDESRSQSRRRHLGKELKVVSSSDWEVIENIIEASKDAPSYTKER